VSTAVQRLHPFGIDVSTGVESAPRLKDFNKMKKFIEGARSV
jgi:phosphoribosylanthranilate isomerase